MPDMPKTPRNLIWTVGIPRHLKVYPVDVQLIWPSAKCGRPRQRFIPDVLSVAAEDMLADAEWQNITWRTATKGKLKARFAGARSAACISIHEGATRDCSTFFSAVQHVFLNHGGRPHWGKMHFCSAKQLERSFSRWNDFV